MVTHGFLDDYFYIIFPIFAFNALGLLLYPLAGYIAEVFSTKLKMMAAGTAAVVSGYVILTALVVPARLENMDTLLVFAYLPLIAVIAGMGAFQANIIPFGVDQLDFASSEVLSSFVQWYYWTCYVFFSLASLAMSFLVSFTQPISELVDDNNKVILLFLVPLPFILLALIPVCCCSWLTPDVAGRGNPFRLVWHVMRFAKSHNHPLRRSAFTYCERPSRLDLAKKRYGGPFTTEQVEIVKSFWRILLVLASLIGFQLLDNTSSAASLHAMIHPPTNFSHPSPQWQLTAMSSTWTITSLVVLLAVPLHQFVLRPYFLNHYSQGMLVKMGLGLFIQVVSLLLTAGFTANVLLAVDSVNNGTLTNGSSTPALLCATQYRKTEYYIFADSCPNEACLRPPDLVNPNLLAVPQFFNGLSHVLVFPTALEFVLAQSPRAMQGLLVGLWYSMQSVNMALSVFESPTCVVFYWQYYVCKAALALGLMMGFVYVAFKYKYSRRDEESDVNVRIVIEEYTWRSLFEN